MTPRRIIFLASVTTGLLALEALPMHTPPRLMVDLVLAVLAVSALLAIVGSYAYGIWEWHREGAEVRSAQEWHEEVTAMREGRIVDLTGRLK